MVFTLIKPRSTGRWDLTAAMHAINPIDSGQFIVEREGDTVWLDFRDLQAESQGASAVSWRNLLPVGMRPPAYASSNYLYLPLPPRASAESMRVDIYGGIDVYDSLLIRGLVAFRTTQTMISTVPGGVKL